MINYNGGDIFLQEATRKDLLLTDGTVTVSGNSYTVTGATVTITNELLDSEAFELKQSLCSESQIHFGSCDAAQISFTMHENIPTIKGKTLKAYLIPSSDASKILQIGVFKVAEDKLSADRTKRTITAYDALYDILNSDVASWYNTLLPNSSSSCTLAQFRASFLSHFGITAESTTLVNDSITIKRTIEPEQLSGADVIKAICEINGCFGQITNEGKFRFVVLAADLDSGIFPSDILYPADDLYPEDVNPTISEMPKSMYIDVQFEDYNSESITQLTIRSRDDDVGVTVGTAGNHYFITGNFLVYNYNATNLTNVANGILGNITDRYYRPCSVNAIGNPLHEVGDGIRIRTQYRGIVAYILERKMSGIQALRDTYSAQGTQQLDGQLNSVSSQFKQLSGKVASLKVDADGIEARVESIESGSASVIQQLDDEISARVTKTGIVDDLNSQMSSGIYITPYYISFTSDGALLINTSNLTVDENGNAEFSGKVTGALITGSELRSGTPGSNMISLVDGVLLANSSNGSIIITASTGDIEVIGSGNIYINGNRVLTEADLPISGGNE